MVYVDDFKKTGKPANMKNAWTEIAINIELDQVGQLHCLGCKHVQFETKLNSVKVRGMEFNMMDYMRNCVDTYQAIARTTAIKLRKVDTPFHPLLTGGEGGLAAETSQTSQSVWG